tara:strand:- start:1318 stop:2283 length:966 start_codon:yes stop_codon:yes gene_type:complete
MSSNIILIVLGEPNSTFSEILFKYFKSKNFRKNKSIIVLIGNHKLLIKQMRKLNYNFFINEIKDIKESKKQKINIINVDYKFKTAFAKITNFSNKYIENSFEVALKILKLNKLNKLINGPISKTHFLKKRFPGITEYIGSKTESDNQVMLIYNKNLAVTPLTTHIPLKDVAKKVTKNKIIKTAIIIDSFYKSKLKKKPNIAILGLNPHCETIANKSEEENEITPAIKFLIKKNINVFGPYPADTFFLKKNIKKFDVVIGMYHDQVLTPVKTLFKFEAINITLGLPFIKITPDHGPNFEMIGKNKSDPTSIFYAFDFLNKIR